VAIEVGRLGGLRFGFDGGSGLEGGARDSEVPKESAAVHGH
jgi:hypothetical protein